MKRIRIAALLIGLLMSLLVVACGPSDFNGNYVGSFGFTPVPTTPVAGGSSLTPGNSGSVAQSTGIVDTATQPVPTPATVTFGGGGLTAVPASTAGPQGNSGTYVDNMGTWNLVVSKEDPTSQWANLPRWTVSQATQHLGVWFHPVADTAAYARDGSGLYNWTSVVSLEPSMGGNFKDPGNNPGHIWFRPLLDNAVEGDKAVANLVVWMHASDPSKPKEWGNFLTQFSIHTSNNQPITVVDKNGKHVQDVSYNGDIEIIPVQEGRSAVTIPIMDHKVEMKLIFGQADRWDGNQLNVFNLSGNEPDPAKRAGNH